MNIKVFHCDKELLERNKTIVHNLRIIMEHVIEPQKYCEE